MIVQLLITHRFRITASVNGLSYGLVSEHSVALRLFEETFFLQVFGVRMFLSPRFRLIIRVLISPLFMYWFLHGERLVIQRFWERAFVSPLRK